MIRRFAIAIITKLIVVAALTSPAHAAQPGPDSDGDITWLKFRGTERCVEVMNEMTWLLSQDDHVTCVRPDLRHLYGEAWNPSIAGWYQPHTYDTGTIYVVDDPGYDREFLRYIAVHEYGHAVDWDLNGQDHTSCWYNAECAPYALEPYAREYTWIYSDVAYRADIPSFVPAPQSFNTWYTKLSTGYYGPLKYQRDIRRLYLAMYRREPDAGGALYWTARLASGTSTKQMGEFFAGSGEFYRMYGDLTHAEFVNRLYLNVLGRPADGAGAAYWTNELKSHRKTRGEVLAYFADSNEFRIKTGGYTR